jgi:B12-binding domain/radical SAM domain protein
MKTVKRRIFFRIFSGNRLTMPLLLNIWESNGLDRHFEIRLLEAEPNALSAKCLSGIRANDVFIYSFMTPHLPAIAAETSKIKARGGRQPLLAVGGPHASAEPDAAMGCGFDVIFRGPGEETFLRFGHDLLEGNIAPGSSAIYDGRTVPGAQGTEHGMRAWERYIPVSAYMRTVPPLEITRGCFWRCGYCQTGGGKPRYRGLDSIGAYLAELRRRNMPRIGFISPSALEYGAGKRSRPDMDQIQALLELSRSAGFRFVEYGIFPSEVRPDTVRGVDLGLLRKYVSNRRLTFGAQSASDERLKAIGRGHQLDDIIAAVESANSAGFAANLDFIIALPGETAADRRDLLALLKTLRRKYRVFFQLHHFFPLAGSPFARRRPSFLGVDERLAFGGLKKNGLASDWWLAGERAVKSYFRWLENKLPAVYDEYH